MTNKEELIKAAETIKNHCKGWSTDCDEDCILSGVCNYLYDFNNISECMDSIVSYVRHSDD